MSLVIYQKEMEKQVMLHKVLNLDYKRRILKRNYSLKWSLMQKNVGIVRFGAIWSDRLKNIDFCKIFFEETVPRFFFFFGFNKKTFVKSMVFLKKLNRIKKFAENTFFEEKFKVIITSLAVETNSFFFYLIIRDCLTPEYNNMK